MTRPLPPDLRARLAKLFPLLGSDKSGEAQAAAAAITRILTTAGFDWHDFTAAMQAPPPPVVDVPWHEGPGRASSSPPAARSTSAAYEDSLDLNGTELVDMIREIVERHPRLNPSSVDFLNSMEERALRYPTVFVSPKQWKWLTDLAGQAGVSVPLPEAPPF